MRIAITIALLACAMAAIGFSPRSSVMSASDGVRILGPEEIVFDWTTDRCDMEDIPDLPARVFRDADGKVQLIATHFVGRRMIGKTLDTVKRDCRIVMNSHQNPDPSKFDDHEWLTSLYTLDGRTIYVLVHNEYQGHTHRGQCPSGDYAKCWVNSVTLATSTDGGRSYSHAPAPNHLVASAPYKYEPDTGPWGIFSPSNIVYNPNDGYYYALLHLEQRGLQQWGTCVMRTRTLDDPKSWRAWDGIGFNMQFIDPYKNPNANPAEHVCQPVSRDQIQKMHESLSFNTHFNKFLVVGAAGQYDAARGKVVWGFYYSLSDDLINWTPIRLLMEAKQPWDTRTPGEPLIYPSLIGPEDMSRNFEITGKRAYLYYVRWHPYTQANQGLDRDLVRVMIEFD